MSLYDRLCGAHRVGPMALLAIVAGALALPAAALPAAARADPAVRASPVRSVAPGYRQPAVNPSAAVPLGRAVTELAAAVGTGVASDIDPPCHPSWVYLQASSQLYVTPDSEGELHADARAPGGMQLFHVCRDNRWDAGQYALKAGRNDRWVTTDLAGSGQFHARLRADRTRVGLWELFEIRPYDQTFTTIRSVANGKYVGANLVYNGALGAYADSVGGWELFRKGTA